jgi:hypothetical protein
MNFINRYFAIIWAAASFLAVMFWLVLMKQFAVMHWLEYSSLVCALYLFYNSRSLRSKKYRLMTMASYTALLGLGLRIMRWPAAFEVQVISTGMLMIAYLLFFIRETTQNWLDWLKVSAAMLGGIALLFRTLRLPLPLPELQILMILIAPVYVGVAILEARGKDLSLPEPELEKEIPEDIL